MELLKDFPVVIELPVHAEALGERGLTVELS